MSQAFPPPLLSADGGGPRGAQGQFDEILQTPNVIIDSVAVSAIQ